MKNKNKYLSIKFFFPFILLLFLLIRCSHTSSATILVNGIHEPGLNNNCKFSGRILDKDTNEPLVGVSISIDSTSFEEVSDINGNYDFHSVPPGTYMIRVKYLSYQTLVTKQIRFDKNKRYLIDFGLQYIAIPPQY